MDTEIPVTGTLVPIDEEGVIIAYLRMDPDGTIRFLWLPDIFQLQIDDETREEIVALLRLYADKLESREMDARFHQFADINIKSADS